LWSLGCIIYFLLTGKHLFTGKSEYLIFKKIKNLDYNLKEEIPSQAKSFIKELLKIEPKERLGKNRNFQEIFEHEFFYQKEEEYIKETEEEDYFSEKEIFYFEKPMNEKKGKKKN
jgi:serine/threonine protein kinase